MSTLLRIVKVGGSLFEQADLSDRLQRWIAHQPPGMTVLLAGCGELGESVRKFDKRFQLGEARSHALCIELLGVTAQLLASLLPEAKLCSDWRAILERTVATPMNAPVVFHPVAFLRDAEPVSPGEVLPLSWDVSTDSIAARFAELVRADDLVLLKSRLPPPFTLLDELADCNYVDRYFPWAVKPLAEVRFVNLCDSNFPQVYAFE
jgi:aspartokinase-like uncharacterized kinase